MIKINTKLVYVFTGNFPRPIKMETKRSNSRKGRKISLSPWRPMFFTVKKKSPAKENLPNTLLFSLAASFPASGHIIALIFPLITGRRELAIPC